MSLCLRSVICSARVKSAVKLSTAASFRSSSVRSLFTSPVLNMPARVKIYTRTGDAGTSALFNMDRMPKNDVHFMALGDTDELNAHIGHARELILAQDPAGLGELADQLADIMSRLFDVGAHLATPRPTSSSNQTTMTAFEQSNIEELERWIDAMDATLPGLKHFILPSGGPAATSLHVARACCRRAERTVIPLIELGDTDRIIQQYLNRLSDYLFVAARYTSANINQPETIWRKPRRSQCTIKHNQSYQSNTIRAINQSILRSHHIINHTYQSRIPSPSNVAMCHAILLSLSFGCSRS